MASSRTELRRRRDATQSVLPADRPRAATSLGGLSIDGRALSLRVGDRLTGAVLERTIEGANTLSIELWDQDRRVLTSGVLGQRVLTRAAEVTADGLTYTVAGFARSGDTLSVTCEDATITVLKRHRPKHPLNVARGRMTRAQAAATAVRRAGVPVVVLDELVVQPIKGARKLRDELTKAKRDTSAQSSKGRSSIIGMHATGLKVKGNPVDKEQRRNIARVLAAAGKVPGVTPRALLAAVLAPIGEADYRVGAAEKVYGTHKGLYQSDQIPASDVDAQVKHFLIGGRSFAAGGAITAAREHPDWSVGKIVSHVEVQALGG